MTEPKFTPPTWTVYERWNGQLEIHGNERVVGDDEICDVVAENVLERDANLIAAAPLMYLELEALVTLFREYEAHHLQKSDNFKAERNRLCAEKIERVLAKARGESIDIL